VGVPPHQKADAAWTADVPFLGGMELSGQAL